MKHWFGFCVFWLLLGVPFAPFAPSCAQAQTLIRPAVTPALLDSLNTVVLERHLYQDPAEGFALTKQALALADSLGDAAAHAHALRNQGFLYYNWGNYELAMEAFLEALPHFRQTSRHAEESRLLTYLGLVYGALGDWNMARNFHESAALLAKEHGNLQGIAQASGHLALMHLQEGHISQAYEAQSRAHQINLDLVDSVALAHSLAGMGQILYAEGAYGAAQDSLQRSLAICQRLGIVQLPGKVHYHLARVALAQNDPRPALASAQAGLQSAMAVRSLQDVRNCYWVMAQCHKVLGQWSQAWQNMELYNAYQDSLNSQQMLRRVLELQNRRMMMQQKEEINALQEAVDETDKERQITDLKLKNNRFLNILLFAFIAFALALLASFGLRATKRLQVNAHLSEQNEQIIAQKEEIESQRDELAKQQGIIANQNVQLNNKADGLEREVASYNADLRRTNMHLKQASRELDTLFYKSYHDLRGPVASFRGLVQLALMEGSSKAEEYLHRLGVVTDHMEHVLERLRNIAIIRLEPVEVEELNPEDELIRVLTSLHDMPGRDIVGISWSTNGIDCIRADRRLLEISLRNLLMNALQYYREQTDEERRIHIEIKRLRKDWSISVTDNGQGIEKSIVPYIFDMFYRGTERSTGSGLGLYMARLAVRQMGGSLKYLRTGTELTEFRIKIPVS